MKIKHILLLCTLFFLMSQKSIAQFTNIPNGGFEEWKNDTLFEDLNNFFTSNFNCYSNGLNANVTKINYMDGSAARLETIDTSGDTLFGFIANANIVNNEGVISYHGGQPYTGKPDSILIEMDYDIMPEDSALIIVAFKKAGQVISENLLHVGGKSTNWLVKKFLLKLLSTNPDTVVIACISSDPFMGNEKVGSSISVDNFQFTGGGGTPIVNGKMENWSLKTLLEPETWGTWNFYDNYSSFKTATKTTDKLKGNYALRLESYASNISGPNLQFGMVASASFFNNFDNLGAFPFTGNPKKFTFDIKYLPVISKDTALIYVTFSKYDDAIQSTKYVGSAFLQVPNTVSNYTHYEIPINLSETPDTASVIIFAGSQSVPKNGSVLFVDNLGFDNQALGIEAMSSPLEAGLNYIREGQFGLNSNLTSEANVNIQLIDLSGRIIYANTFSNVPPGKNVILFSIPNIRFGMYAYSIQSDQDISSNKILIY